MIYEVDGDIRELYPQEARLRSLTYHLQIYIDITCTKFPLDENRQRITDEDLITLKKVEKAKLGNIPLMLRSKYCILHGKIDRDLTKVGECVFDQGGYFIINGSEKVRPLLYWLCCTDELFYNCCRL